MDGFIARHIFKRRFKSPYDTLSRYGVLLHCFTMPLLTRVFPEVFSPSLGAIQTQECFDQFIHLPHIKSLGGRRYKCFDLLRTVLAEEVRGKEPGIWEHYHKLAVEVIPTTPGMPAMPTLSAEWHYHNIAYRLSQGDAAAVAYWKQMLLETEASSMSRAALIEAVHDETLLLTAVAREAQSYKQKQSISSGDGCV